MEFGREFREIEEIKEIDELKYNKFKYVDVIIDAYKATILDFLQSTENLTHDKLYNFIDNKMRKLFEESLMENGYKLNTDLSDKIMHTIISKVTDRIIARMIGLRGTLGIL